MTSSAFVTVAVLMACFTTGYAITSQATVNGLSLSYTENDFSDSSTNATHCGILTNYRYKSTMVSRFYTHIEDCDTTNSQTLCEVKVAFAGDACPTDYNDFTYDNSCYKIFEGWRKPDVSAALCRHYNTNGRLVHIEDTDELSALGPEIFFANSATSCSYTAEYALGNTAPPDAE